MHCLVRLCLIPAACLDSIAGSPHTCSGKAQCKPARAVQSTASTGPALPPHLPAAGHVTFFWNGNRSGYLDPKLEKFQEVGWGFELGLVIPGCLRLCSCLGLSLSSGLFMPGCSGGWLASPG